FSQTEWYARAMSYVDLGQQGIAVLMLLLAVLMVSNVKYPRFPPIGLRSAAGIFGLIVHLLILLGGIFAPESFLFPLGLTYLAYGLVRATILGLMQNPAGSGPADEADDPDATDEFRVPRRRAAP
ncbi:MAG TPA: hypothetical protein VK012_05935, partial [Gemmatimonadales bacterium]|nr:hypothetical protein [Gemmatimonadales bacterium]